MLNNVCVSTHSTYLSSGPTPLPPCVEGEGSLGREACGGPLVQGPHQKGAGSWGPERGHPHPQDPVEDASLHTHMDTQDVVETHATVYIELK